MVKLNEGFSGEGNAVFSFAGAPTGPGLQPWVSERLPKLGFEAEGMDWETYRTKLREMGAIVEAFIEGQEKRSPSAQYRVEPDGTLDMISTHDQVLGGPSGQIYLGCEFPADPAYRLEIQAAGRGGAAAAGARGAGPVRDRLHLRAARPGWEHTRSRSISARAARHIPISCCSS